MPVRKDNAAEVSAPRQESDASRPVFIARPRQGKVDFAELRRATMNRFARTLAYLAK